MAGKASNRRTLDIALTVVLVGFASLAHSGGGDSVKGFQELQWGTSEKEVYQKYAGRIRMAECTPITEMSSKVHKHVCDHPVIEPYEVVGIPFSLGFYLTEGTRRLDGVGLTYSAEVEEAANKSWEQVKDEWSRKYRLLRSALTEKYGANDYERMAPPHPILMMADAVWRRGSTKIELSAKVTKGGRYLGPWEEYSVYYTPTAGGDAGKL